MQPSANGSELASEKGTVFNNLVQEDHDVKCGDIVWEEDAFKKQILAALASVYEKDSPQMKTAVARLEHVDWKKTKARLARMTSKRMFKKNWLKKKNGFGKVKNSNFFVLFAFFAIFGIPAAVVGLLISLSMR